LNAEQPAIGGKEADGLLSRFSQDGLGQSGVGPDEMMFSLNSLSFLKPGLKERTIQIQRAFDQLFLKDLFRQITPLTFGVELPDFGP
jgi:hypothetical protein